MSSRIQVAALVQLEFTYITATLFFDRDAYEVPEDVGLALVAANCVVALLVIVVIGRSVGDISTELGELRLTFQVRTRVCK